MKGTLHFLFFFFLCFLSGKLTGQENASQLGRDQWILVQDTILFSDSLSILPGSVVLTDRFSNPVPDSCWILDNHCIRLRPEAFAKYLTDSLHLQCQMLSFNLGKSFSTLDSLSARFLDEAIIISISPPGKQKKEDVLGAENLDYTGSFSRGFSAGNNQSLVLNSDFNLQLTGTIGQNIGIMATLTDANIPIQTEGNTYQLNEFDQVFIRLSQKEHQLLAGDLDLRNPDHYFSRYRKKLKGVQYKDLFSLKHSGALQTEAAYAISRGKFARQQLVVQEGNQGPYKLIGSGGERFLIVLSGTEKVYFDGELLKRGSENDYVIDYNLAELVFTFNRLITKDSRIVVEFEYADQSYLRSMQNLNAHWKTQKHEFYLGMYNEQDGKNALGDLQLDSTDISILTGSGDKLQNASRSGIRRIDSDQAQNPDQVGYILQYSAEAGDSILVYTSSPDSARYTAYFSDLGENMGSYEILPQTTINGRAYRWVGPGKGRYEPEVRLVAPELKQLYTLGTRLKLGDQTGISAELALSHRDLNRFSSIDNEDNLGSALTIGFNTRQNIGEPRDSLPSGSFESRVRYEWTGTRFQPLNPYRETEFNRNWNLFETMPASDQHLLIAENKWHRKALSLAYGLSAYHLPGLFTGHNHKPDLIWQTPQSTVKAGGNFLWTNTTATNSRFLRPDIEWKYRIKKWQNATIGLRYQLEENRLTGTSDSLQANSFRFSIYQLSLQTGQKSPVPFQWFVKYREDFIPESDEFRLSYRAVDAGIRGKWHFRESSRLDFNVSYRDLRPGKDPVVGTAKPGSTLLGKISHDWNVWGDFLQMQSRIDLNSGQEAKSEFVFIELTVPGEGNYIWIDSNNDGVRQKGEFESAPFSDEANFIKILQYNNEFIQVNNNLFNHSFQIEPKQLIKTGGKNKYLNPLSRFSLRGTITYNRKTRDDQTAGFVLPFLPPKTDSSVVNLTSNRQYTLYYNKGGRTFDGQVEIRQISGKNLQLDGLVESDNRYQSLRFRLSLLSQTDLIILGKTGNKIYAAELYPLKNYDFRYTDLETEIKWRSSQKLGVTLAYQFLSKNNRSSLKENLTGHTLKTRIQLRNWMKANVTASFSYARYRYTGESGNSIELAMLEGLKDGSNFLWQGTITRKISEQIDLSFRYDGRKTGSLKTVHVASMEARARF